MTPCLFTLRLEPRFCQFFPKDIELCSRTASGPCSSLSALLNLSCGGFLEQPGASLEPRHADRCLFKGPI